MFGLGKFSPNIDEVQILIIYLHNWPPIIKKLNSYSDYFLVVWQTVRRSMLISERSAYFDTVCRQVALQMCYSNSFLARNCEVQFWSFFPSLITHGMKTRRAIVLVFGTLGECRTMYSNQTKSSAEVDALRR